MRVFLLSVLLTPAAGMAASGGADALLESVGADTAQKSTLDSVTSRELSDPFLIQLFAQLQVDRSLPYEVKLWAQKVLQKDFAGAAHLWTAIQKHLPGGFEPVARAAYLYSLWNLNVAQTFFDEWVTSLSRKSFLDSVFSSALDQTLTSGFDSWLQEHSVEVSQEQRRVLLSVDPARGSHYVTLRAWTALRSAQAAEPVLDLLAADHWLKVPVAQTVALAAARRGDLPAAGAVLKRHVEPSIEAVRDTVALSRHYLQVARLLYQAGALDGAREFYERIPDRAPDFLKAREELAWVWLRQGDTARLRGELKTLRSSVFKGRFSPDVYVLRAISNLKLCFYSEVEAELNAFVKDNESWAKRINEAMASSDPPALEDDRFVQFAVKALASRRAESELLEALATQSITATLPAVGPQQHWERARKRALVAAEHATKQLAEEHRRGWANYQTVLTEAIRKMQFVKVELFSQVRTLSREESGAPSGAVSALERDLNTRLKQQTQQALKATSDRDLVFPFDGVLWPDELFRLTSVAESLCQKRSEGR